MIDNDRSLLKLILLSVLTCGIYMYIFLYQVSEDMNKMCAGDGDDTPGLLQFILLSVLTCGIYAWVWYYKWGDRLYRNAPRYGLRFEENGTTVLLWMLFGGLLCGVGVYIAWYILIKNTNTMANAYNAYFYSGGQPYGQNTYPQ